jgi:DNA adenine methylase
MIRIMTSNRAVSLQNVAIDIVKVANVYNIEATWIDRMIPSFQLRKNNEIAIIVMAVDPLIASPWILLARDLNHAGVKNVFYGPVEGKLNRRYVYDWMREVNFIAVSNYVRDKLIEAGLKVIDVVHHGIDIETIVQVKNMKSLGLGYLSSVGLDPEKHIIVTTIANSHPRKGLAWLDKIISEIEKRDSSIKFLVITEEKGSNYFKKHDNLVLKTDFGKLPRNTILSIIANSHILAIPSLSEGFGLPVLEAMALGTPVVHTSLPPLLEFSTGFVVPARQISIYDRFDVGSSGILFEQHLYDVNEFADVIIQIIDMYRNRREALIDWRAKSFEVAYKMNIYSMYKKLLKHLVSIDYEYYTPKIPSIDFTDLPKIPQPSPSAFQNDKHDAVSVSVSDEISEELLKELDKLKENAKLTKPLRYPGGDWYIKDEIIDLLVKSRSKVLVEVFGGSGVISMYAPRDVFKSIVYNDIDSLLTNFFIVLKERPRDLQKRLVLTPVSRDVIRRYVELYNSGEIHRLDPVEKAVAIFLLTRATFDARRETFQTDVSKSLAKNVKRHVALLTEYSKMWQDVTIENLDFRELIKKYDRDYTVFYCDPPFLLSSREGRSRYYKYLFKEQDMRDLLDMLEKIKGRFVLKLPEDHMKIDFIKEWIERNKYNIKTVEHVLLMKSVVGGERERQKTLLIYNYSI